MRGNLVYAYADDNGDILESDEANNIGNSGTSCQFEPTPGPLSPVEEWNWNSSATLPSHVQVMMTPIVASITDDNADGLIDENDVPDVVFSTFAGVAYYRDSVIRAVKGDDGTGIFTTPLTADLDVLGEGCIAVADIDGDGLPEIIANEDIAETHNIEQYGRLIVFEHDGAFKLKSDLMNDGRLRWGAVSVADLNADASPEMIVGHHIFDDNGALLAKGTSRKGDNGIGPLSTVADIDRDGRPDIVAGFTVYDVITDGGNNIIGMDVKWEARDASGAVVSGDGFPGVANFDGDDKAEIIVVSNGSVWLFDDDGSHIWGPRAIPGGGRGGAPNVDDFDDDGQVEVGTAGASRYAVYDADGTLLWSMPTFDSSSNVTGSSVFDFEGDGSAEVIYKDQTFLRVYRGTDGVVLASIATGSGTTYENPVIADVDKYGNAEIIVCANNYAYGSKRGIQVFGDANDQWVNTRRIWNQHTYHITNINDDATVPITEADNWLTFNSFRSQKAGSVMEVFAAPDVTASFLRQDTTPCPDGFGVTVRVGNGGSNVAASPVRVAFYDGDPSAGGTVLGVGETSVDLDPGEFEDVTLVMSSTPVTPFEVCAVVDDDGTGTGALSECEEGNNSCCTVFDEICPPEIVAVPFDIHPTSCPNPLNTRKKGVVPAAVVGTSDFDVDLVALSSLFLEGVAPIRTKIEDVTTPVVDGEDCDCTTEGPDGFDDLTMKFDGQDLIAALGPVTDRETRRLTLTGTLLDGTSIEGTDCVIILAPSQAPQGIEVVNLATGDRRISWDGSEDSDFLYYGVYRGAGPDFYPVSPEDYFATTSDRFFVDADVSPGEIWYYRVAAFDEPLLGPGGEEEAYPVFSGYSEPSPGNSTDAYGVVPESFELRLLGSVPNPFSSTTRIVYTLPERMAVRLSVYDVAGRLVDRLVNGVQPPGRHVVAWEARGLASGTYSYRLEAGTEVRAKQVMIVR